MNKKNKLGAYSGFINNRLLSESLLNIISSGDLLSDEDGTILVDEEKDIYKNCKDDKSRRKIIKKILLKAEERNKLLRKKKNTLLNRIDSYFEKKIFNELECIDKMNNNCKNDKTAARRMLCRKVVSNVITPLLLFLIGIVFLICFWALAISTGGETSQVLTTISTTAHWLSLVISVVLIFGAILVVLYINYTLRKIKIFKIKKENNPKI
ncbi:Plasmodium exported protein (Pm-fam-a like), unknown function [Plasmodium malariae]|uniref:PIR Superfamily Protein n=1 Tax=Plasmodium malariae TaxID=5858 RepID=A0A1A8X6C8_PLAMA|nr:Plasmodium exported protein (Pm-fam-a like), unknown function [Plasmodium malariae]